MSAASSPSPLGTTRSWADDIALRAVGDQRYEGEVGDHWTSLQGAHGGIVAALAVAATEDVLGAADATTARPTLRAATFGYARGNRVGPLTVEVEVVRRGRSMVTSHATVSQDGQPTTVARLHHSVPWDGAVYSDAPPAPVRPADARRLIVPGPAHLNNAETFLHPDTQPLANGPRAEWLAWSRPLVGEGEEARVESTWLTMFGDFFPPAVFARSTSWSRAVTIEYSVQVHRAEPGWTLAADQYLAARMHAFHSHDGFAVEDGWIHLPDGSLLATVRQTRLAG